MKSKLYPLFFAILIPFFIIFILFISTKNDLDIVFDRMYTDSLIIRQSSIDLGLKNPTRLQINRGIFYINDMAEGQIFCISKEGRSVKAYPRDCGQDKFGLVLGYSVDTSKLLVLDQRKKQYYRIDLNRDLIRSDTLEAIERAVPVNDSLILGMELSPKDHEVSMVFRNIRNRLETPIAANLVQYHDGGFGNDGLFSHTSVSNKAVYLLYHIGRFYVIDFTDLTAKAYSTIDRYSKAPEFVKSGHSFTLSRKTLTVNRISANNSKYLFVISNIKTRKDKINNLRSDIMDVYDLSTGAYLNSISIEGTDKAHVVDLYADDHTITLLTRTQLLRYAIH